MSPRRCAKSRNRVPFSAGVPLRNCAHSAPQWNPSAGLTPRRERSERRRASIQAVGGFLRGGFSPVRFASPEPAFRLDSDSVAQPVRPKPLAGRGLLVLLLRRHMAGRGRWCRQEPCGGGYGCRRASSVSGTAAGVERRWHPPERSVGVGSAGCAHPEVTVRHGSVASDGYEANRPSVASSATERPVFRLFCAVAALHLIPKR